MLQVYPGMEYLPTVDFGGKCQVNIPYIEHMGKCYPKKLL